MSGIFDSVMTQLAAGASPRSAARTLGISLDLAEAVAEEATRMGLVVSGGSACGTCVPASSPACAGCPFTDGRAAGATSRSGPTPVTLTPLTFTTRPRSR
ncbi:hypothetical protein [Demequina lutea]|uniref:Uncharacterized protein n=1 Tax=Demequina lutea TaxID=431489 RepID=A0A7Z0CIF3_9MICO|nr:hypothetical protein [Demequina lutea]NYI39898.1 hypothetical protein [Demequina lutea]